MDSEIIFTYCVCDDLLKGAGHRDDVQCKVSDAEVMTIGLIAGRYFSGNYHLAYEMLHEQRYIPYRLSKGCLSKRLHRVRDQFLTLFAALAECVKPSEDAPAYIVDSFPVVACDNIRIPRCRLYQGEAYRGYCASKRRYFYGLRLHLLVTADRYPVEFFLVPGASNDTGCLDLYDFDLPTPARIVADKGFTDYELEDVMQLADLTFAPLRKSNSKRPLSYLETNRRTSERRPVETAGSRFNAFLPKAIHATSQLGFELKVVLFVLALALSHFSL